MPVPFDLPVVLLSHRGPVTFAAATRDGPHGDAAAPAGSSPR